MTATPIPTLDLPAPWTLTITARSKIRLLAELERDDASTLVIELERCAAGRLRHAYPASSHDIEIRILDGESSMTREVLRVLTAAVEAADPQCRRVVFAATAGDRTTIADAQAAGFRYVVDVDLPNAELSVLVAEQHWVTAVDLDLDHVPGT